MSSALVFHRGFLYALRLRAEHFFALSTRFHEAYGAMLKKAVELGFGVAKDLLDDFDPMFGVYHDVDVLLAEGLRDCVLRDYGPSGHIRLDFSIPYASARIELARLHDTRFRILAEVFIRKLLE